MLYVWSPQSNVALNSGISEEIIAEAGMSRARNYVSPDSGVEMSSLSDTQVDIIQRASTITSLPNIHQVHKSNCGRERSATLFDLAVRRQNPSCSQVRARFGRIYSFLQSFVIMRTARLSNSVSARRVYGISKFILCFEPMSIIFNMLI